jgi:hypothetical protein
MLAETVRFWGTLSHIILLHIFAIHNQVVLLTVKALERFDQKIP